MRKRNRWKQLTALALAGCMITSTGVSGSTLGEVQAAGMTEAQWTEIQDIVSRYYGEWNSPNYSGAITDGMPTTALLGNGDVGITSAGNEFQKSFYVSKSDFWTYGGSTGTVGSCPPISIGGVTIEEQVADEVPETDPNLAPGYKEVTASSYHENFTPDLAVNGDMQQTPSGYGWVSKRPQDEQEGGVVGVQDFWLQLEFEEAITIGRYVVKSDGAVRDTEEGRGNNTKAFVLQVSEDGTDWTDVDSVTDNTESVFEKNLETAVTTKFVRLFITEATQGLDNNARTNPRARIGQFELYANPKEETEEPPVETESKNLALNKPVQVSGYIANPGTEYHSPGEMLVDGDGTKKWCSTPNENKDGSAVYWAMLDLGEAKDISRWIVKHAQAGGEIAGYNTRDFKLQYTTEENPDPANEEIWKDADVVEGNTEAITDRNLETPINTRYVRLLVTKPTQGSNDAVRIYEMELYKDAKDLNTVFYEKQDILNAEIQTRQELAGTPTEMKTWLSADKNIMVTELKSNGSKDGQFQVETGASANDKANKPITAENDESSVTVTRRTKNTSPNDENAHVSQAAMSTKIIGADDVAVSSDNEAGKGTLKFTLGAGETVYIVTSIGGGGRTFHKDGITPWEGAEPVSEAQELLAGITDENAVTELNGARQAWWKDFWCDSYIDFGIEDEKLNKVQKYYYGAQYLLGSASKEGELAPGLYGIWHTTDNARWSSDYHLNYNFISTFYGTNSSNRPEVALSAVQSLLDYVPEGQRRATSTEELKRINKEFVEQKVSKGDIDPVNGIEGAILFPVGIAPWGMTTDNVYLNEALDAAYNSYVMTQYYDYTMDKEFLTANDYAVYNYMKQAVVFYEAWLEKEETDRNEDGYEYVLYAGYNEGSWAKNPAVELAALKNTISHLIKFSEDLGLDEEKRADWIDIYEHLGPQPTTDVGGKKVLALGEKQKSGNDWVELPSPIPGDGNAIPLDAMVPGNVYNYFSSPEDLQMVRDTISVFSDRGAWGQINNFPRLFQEAVKSRYDIDTVVTKLVGVIERQMAPNLRINDGVHGIEKTGATEAVNSMMLASEDGITKIFPNWYADKDAKFVNLRARGAFNISAEHDGAAQEAKNVTITSEAGENMTLVSPWKEGMTVKDSQGKVVKTTVGTVPNWEDTENATYSFDTKAGETYTVEKGAPEEPSKNTLKFFLDKAQGYVDDGTVEGLKESIQKLFAEAIEEGNAVYADENATEDEVFNATLKLMKAVQSVGFTAADKTDLKEAIKLAEMINLADYVTAGQEEFKAALDVAKAVDADGDAWMDDVDKAWNDLLDAMANLRLKADKSTLEKLLGELEGLDLSKYTEESIAKYNMALEAAKDVMANEELSEDDQETVEKTVKTLQAAYEALELKEGGDTGDNKNSGNNANNSGTNGGNTKSGSSGNKAVKTGDESSAVLPMAGIGISVLLILVTGVFFRRRKYK